MGIGLMLKSIPSVFMMKQQDFLLLGVDQLVNTWSALKSRGPFVPFVIAMIVVDNGWEGPQSSFNNTYSLAELSDLKCFIVNGVDVSEKTVNQAFSGGPSLLAISQKMFKKENQDLSDIFSKIENQDYNFYISKKFTTKKIVIISVNFTAESCLEISKNAIDFGLNVSLLVFYTNQFKISNSDLDSFKDAELVVVLDDAKSTSNKTNELVIEIARYVSADKIKCLVRKDLGMWHVPNVDRLDYQEVLPMFEAILRK
jgi:pyruvate dehydrogenase E1 component beta subunit